MIESMPWVTWLHWETNRLMASVLLREARVSQLAANIESYNSMRKRRQVLSVNSVSRMLSIRLTSALTITSRM